MDNKILEKYQYWLSVMDGELKEELLSIDGHPEEIEDRFYCDLSFGTAGMRGVMGAGTNRMNIYMVRKATRGLAEWLALHNAKDGGVVIAWDTRINSQIFALEAALTLASCGVKAYLYSIPSATPLLSYSVRELRCSAGIVITASHNPKEYNGYKVYDQYGCQMVSADANEIASLVKKSSFFDSVIGEDEARSRGLLCDIGENMMQKFCRKVMEQSSDVNEQCQKDLNIVYTPLHGAGLEPVCYTLREKGYNVHVVEEQSDGNGLFPTVRKPNPEEKDALVLAIAKAKEIGAELVLATDPDCDRVGIAVRDCDDYRLLNGNQIGALLVNYILTRKKEVLKDNSVILKSIVTNNFGSDIAKSYGVETIETLTGFKYIGDAMTSFDKNGNKDFIMGYEESYGFLIGNHARDKDAVVASLLISEMGVYYKEKGYTLYDILKSLYHRFGYYYDNVTSVSYSGSAGKEKMKNIMKSLRERDDIFDEPCEKRDYLNGYGGLPPADVLKYTFKDGSWIAVRPSGTEPILKCYYSIKGRNEREASARFVNYADHLSVLVE